MLEELKQKVFKANLDLVKQGLGALLLSLVFCTICCGKNEELESCYSAEVFYIEKDSVYARLALETPDETKPPYPQSVLVFNIKELSLTPHVGDIISLKIIDFELLTNDNFSFFDIYHMHYSAHVKQCK